MYTSIVNDGLKLGRTIGFPTANLNVNDIPKNLKPGVYAAWVTVLGTVYKGALYFGPRLVLDEKINVLEIYIIDFSTEIYGQKVNFTLEQYIREPLDFSSLDTLKTQLKKDVLDVKQLLQNKA